MKTIDIVEICKRWDAEESQEFGDIVDKFVEIMRISEEIFDFKTKEEYLCHAFFSAIAISDYVRDSYLRVK